MPQLIHNYTTFIFWSKHLQTPIKDTIKDSVYTRLTGWLRKPPVEGIGKFLKVTHGGVPHRLQRPPSLETAPSILTEFLQAYFHAALLGVL